MTTDEYVPTEDEVAALIDSLAEQADVSIMPLTASMALQDAHAARRDEEEPSDAEVEAVKDIMRSVGSDDLDVLARQALSAARAARRDEEKR